MVYCKKMKKLKRHRQIREISKLIKEVKEEIKGDNVGVSQESAKKVVEIVEKTKDALDKGLLKEISHLESITKIIKCTAVIFLTFVILGSMMYQFNVIDRVLVELEIRVENLEEVNDAKKNN